MIISDGDQKRTLGVKKAAGCPGTLCFWFFFVLGDAPHGWVGFVLFGRREQTLSKDKDIVWCAGLVHGMIMGLYFVDIFNRLSFVVFLFHVEVGIYK